jgi:AAA+ ATPase superfamily predicted ATPase
MIIRGPRQIGKNWLVREFGKSCFDHTVYINFDANERMKELFSVDMDIHRIVLGLELEAGFKISPEDTLIIFDEVQEVPNALKSLKYFNQDAPEYNIVAAEGFIVPIKELKNLQRNVLPPISVRTSISDYKKEDWLLNMPLYAINLLSGQLKV